MMKTNWIQSFKQNEYKHTNLPKIWKFDQFHYDTAYKGNFYQPFGNLQKNNLEIKIDDGKPFISTTKKTTCSCINEKIQLLSDLLGI